MLKPNIELIRDGAQQALLTWHKPDGEGGHIPIAMEFAETLDEAGRQRIIDVCKRPLNIMENGVAAKALTGSSKHFLNLPKVLARLGYRVRSF